MAEEKTAVTGLVTDDILKQALATREVLNPLKAAVKKLLSEQIDAAVESVLTSLTGQTVQDTGDQTAEDDMGVAGNTGEAGTVKEINTGDDAGSAGGQEAAQAEVADQADQTGAQASGEAAGTGSAAGTQTAEVKTATTTQPQASTAQVQKQA